MEEVVSYDAREGVAVLRISNPPVNALSQAVRAALLEALARAQSDDSVQAIILVGAGATFPAGADIREFEAPAQAPHLPEVCAAIEASPKPVIACLHGTALGGGYELALAAHARLATPGTRVGLPEVGLGIVPGAGGTQRLPRVVAIEDALSLLLSGRPVTLAQDATKGLVDGLVEGDLIAGGIVHARTMSDAPPTPTSKRRTRFEDAFSYQQAVDAARKREGASASRAARAILDCVEAAPLLPFSQGMALERDHFLELRDTAEAQALRHAFVAVREAAKPRDDLPEPATITSVAIIGGGRMGSGIAIACLDAGIEVTLIDRPGETDAAEGRVTGIYRRAVRRGRMAESTQAGRLSRLRVTSEMAHAKGADLILEAAPEDQLLKAGLLSEAAKVAKPGALLATNTSYLDIDDLALASTRPEQFIGLHFFAPAHIQQAVEVVVGEATSPATEASAFALVTALRKKPIFSENAPGFIANRILTAYRRAADYLLEDGASPYAIDAAMQAYGFKMGPYETLDLAGLDVSWAARRKTEAAAEDGARYVRIADAFCEAGRLGQKTGKGYYDYANGGAAREDPAALALIEAERAKTGRRLRRIGAQEIVDDCVMAMVNEGARVLDDGIALRPGDIDAVMMLGLGFPRHRGGPMKAGELKGLLSILRTLEERSEQDAFWTPAQALRDAVKNGNRFSA